MIGKTNATAKPPVTGCVTDSFNIWPPSLFPSISGTSRSLSTIRYTAVNQTSTSQGIWLQGGVTSITVNLLYLEKKGYKYYCIQNTDGAGKWRAPALFYGPLNAGYLPGDTWYLHYWYYDSSTDTIEEYTHVMDQQSTTLSKDTGPTILPGGTKWLITHIEKIQ